MNLRNTQAYLRKTISVVLHGIILFSIVRFFIIEPSVVNGQSMEPVFSDGNVFLVNKAVYLVRTPQRFDIVQMYDEQSGHFFVKRIVGLPGETVTIKRNTVFIQESDGTEWELEEPYISEGNSTRVEPGQESKVTVPEHSYYVLGDNRLYSNDSRGFGPVHRRNIQGKAIEL